MSADDPDTALWNGAKDIGAGLRPQPTMNARTRAADHARLQRLNQRTRFFGRHVLLDAKC